MSARAAQELELRTRDPRRTLSKSWMVSSDMCGWRAWLDIHDPKPFLMSERVAFGKAVDAGVEVIALALGEGSDPDIDAAFAAAMETTVEHGVGIDAGGVRLALERFVPEVGRMFEWGYCHVQPSIQIDVPVIGEVSAHPDIILANGTILDIKTSERAKPANAAATAYLELGFYALVYMEWTGDVPPAVGYVTWVRSRSPYWQVITTALTPPMLASTIQRARAKRAALVADAQLNKEGERPQNWSLTNGPRFAGLCGSCSHAPANGGSCVVAESEES